METTYNIIKENGSFILIACISILFIACHVLYKFNFLFSPSISEMPETKKPLKIVVFDLDETLGCFVEIGIFWDALEKISKNPLVDIKINNESFFEIIDLFPEFLRPNIINILDYLLDKKKTKECDKIMIYTNNQGPKSWAKMISEYFENKLNSKIFDQIIAAFKVQGKKVEMCRTSHDKSVNDLIKCTKIPENTEICFLDDQYHPQMKDSSVYYINLKPYTFSMDYREMAERYYNKYSKKINISKLEFIDTIVIYMKKFNYKIIPKNNDEKDIDTVISKQIIIHLEEFFKKNKRKYTIKKSNKTNKTNKTNKNSTRRDRK